MPGAVQKGQALIRPMREEDVTIVANIEAQVAMFGWTRGMFSDCLNAGYVCRVLEKNQQPVGYGILSTGAEEAHILNLCVRPAFQRQGWGRLLAMRLLESARCYGAATVFLEVRVSNKSAIGLYRRLHFTEMGRRPHYYKANHGRETAIVMALPLSNA